MMANGASSVMSQEMVVFKGDDMFFLYVIDVLGFYPLSGKIFDKAYVKKV